MEKGASRRQLIDMMADARRRTVALVEDLDEDQLMGPELEIINPYLWEIGHVAWFHERWILRHLDGRESLRDDADELYDSIAIGHGERWQLPLPSYEETRAYMEGVREALESRLDEEPTEEETYYYRYTTYHEDMHEEAFTYTRQTLGYAAPRFEVPTTEEMADMEAGGLEGDVEVPGGTFLLGAPEEAPFAFDNERRVHEVELDAFRIARTPVTNEQFREFVEAGGYATPEYWSEDGWHWRCRYGADSPAYWVREEGEWRRRLFDRTVELRPHEPVQHVSWWEAEAYCNWAGRRLPTEAEWEAAAAAEPDGSGGLSERKRRYPWGDEPPTLERANVDGAALVGLDSPPTREVADVGAFPEGDSAFGCRQMFGNVWEWTASTFEPYPGFEPDMYEDYSQPWFGDRKVLRGGAWVTRSRMIRNTWRNYFEPQRRDVYAGFRTCAREA